MSKNAACESSREVRGQHTKRKARQRSSFGKKLGIKTPGLLFFRELLEQMSKGRRSFGKSVRSEAAGEEVLPFSKKREDFFA